MYRAFKSEGCSLRVKFPCNSTCFKKRLFRHPDRNCYGRPGFQINAQKSQYQFRVFKNRPSFRAHLRYIFSLHI